MRSLRRLLVMTGAYFAGVLAFLLGLAVLFGIASLLPDAPSYWNLTAVSPVIFVAAPVVGIFVVLLTMVVSAVPALLILMLTELFGWRSAYFYVFPAALLSAVAYWTFSFRTIGGLDRTGLIEMVLFAVSGAWAGLIYWAIAGRSAGIRNTVPTLTAPPEDSARPGG